MQIPKRLFALRQAVTQADSYWSYFHSRWRLPVVEVTPIRWTVRHSSALLPNLRDVRSGSFILQLTAVRAEE